MWCAKCEKTGGEFLKTAYGDYLCEDCWDDYICTEKGKVEYLIGICNLDYPKSDFDADFLGECTVSWNKYKNELDLSASTITFIEASAKVLGLM